MVARLPLAPRAHVPTLTYSGRAGGSPRQALTRFRVAAAPLHAEVTEQVPPLCACSLASPAKPSGAAPSARPAPTMHSPVVAPPSGLGAALEATSVHTLSRYLSLVGTKGGCEPGPCAQPIAHAAPMPSPQSPTPLRFAHRNRQRPSSAPARSARQPLAAREHSRSAPNPSPAPPECPRAPEPQVGVSTLRAALSHVCVHSCFAGLAACAPAHRSVRKRVHACLCGYFA